MAETSKVKQYFKQCFDKKLLIQKGIIAGIALAIVLIFSLSFYFWLKDKSGDIGYNSFWYISIVWNDGVGFSALRGNIAAIYSIQSIMFILLVAIYLLVSHDKITTSFVALAMFGGLFNLIQRGCAPAEHANCVLDYFKFGFMDFAIFNWPDTFVVIGIFGFVITYVTLTIISAVRESRHEKIQKAKQKEEHEQPKQ